MRGILKIAVALVVAIGTSVAALSWGNGLTLYGAGIVMGFLIGMITAIAAVGYVAHDSKEAGDV